MADRGQADVLLPTPDGSSTAYSSRFGECYHNRNGALSQARHVFLEGSGARRLPAPRILEIGFGLGLNFLTSAADALGRGAALDYLAYENDPQPSRLLAAVGEQLPGHELALWHALLAAWPADQAPAAAACLCASTGPARVRVEFVDATCARLPEDWADAVYLDGFSPAVNPELWSPEFLARLACALRPGGWLATYSAAGAVRRALGAAGLAVERCSGMAGKREWLRAQRRPACSW
jgi:tRNA U34 5-methylaminomethyl-2-thiouridine-forming methyltransferase MnmC